MIRRLCTWVAASLLVAFNAGATNEGTIDAFTYAGPTDRTIAEVLSSRDCTMSAKHINKEGPSDILFFFGAANAVGQHGAHFRTDISLSVAGLSTDGGKVFFSVYVLPGETQGNSLAGGNEWSASPGNSGYIQDVVGQAGLTGPATVIVVIDHAKSTAPSKVRYISGWGRTYTAGQSGGEYSTSLPVTAGWNLSSTSWVAVSGLQQNALKRTNLSVFNHMITATIKPTVYAFGPDGTLAGTFELTIPPLTSRQVSLADFALSPERGGLRVGLSSGQASAFAVTVDNVTNDGDARMLSYREY